MNGYEVVRLCLFLLKGVEHRTRSMHAGNTSESSRGLAAATRLLENVMAVEQSRGELQNTTMQEQDLGGL